MNKSHIWWYIKTLIFIILTYFQRLEDIRQTVSALLLNLFITYLLHIVFHKIILSYFQCVLLGEICNFCMVWWHWLNINTNNNRNITSITMGYNRCACKKYLKIIINVPMGMFNFIETTLIKTSMKVIKKCFMHQSFIFNRHLY